MIIHTHDLGRIDFSDVADMSAPRRPPTPPGEMLREEFLEPLNISQYALAKAIGVSPRRINEIIHGKRGITADTALRLARFFGMTAQFWLNLQTRHDTVIAEEKLRETLMRIPRHETLPTVPEALAANG
jgi:addiction module HigA family antidote